MYTTRRHAQENTRGAVGNLLGSEIRISETCGRFWRGRKLRLVHAELAARLLHASVPAVPYSRDMDDHFVAIRSKLYILSFSDHFQPVRLAGG
jgi:hypothetical protein